MFDSEIDWMSECSRGIISLNQLFNIINEPAVGPLVYLMYLSTSEEYTAANVDKTTPPPPLAVVASIQ